MSWIPLSRRWPFRADALQRGNVVYVKDDSVTEAQGRVPAGFREVQVETGVINSDYVEIVSGDLQEGDQVYVSESSVSSTNSMMPMGGGNMGGMGGAMGGGKPPGRFFGRRPRRAGPGRQRAQIGSVLRSRRFQIGAVLSWRRASAGQAVSQAGEGPGQGRAGDHHISLKGRFHHGRTAAAHRA